MERRGQALLALFLVSLMPTTSILFAYSWSDSELAGQVFFVFAKLWIIAIPIYWLYRVEANNFSIRKLLGLDSLNLTSRNEAIISGLGMFAIIAGTYAVLGDSVDITLMKEEIGATGLLNPTTFFLGAIYWITLNSRNTRSRCDMVNPLATPPFARSLLDISCDSRCSSLWCSLSPPLLIFIRPIVTLYCHYPMLHNREWC